uniref:Uncharacterized protein n=1 Tax=Tanacetum cinerariifolium TaxID=118510 RepID=A0A699JL71_TANCI|nr:hypothetical protein [Tanacetum cinerariifolium]
MDAKAEKSKEGSKHDEEPTRIELPYVEDRAERLVVSAQNYINIDMENEEDFSKSKKLSTKRQTRNDVFIRCHQPPPLNPNRKVPNMYCVPLKDEGHKRWLKFRNVNQSTPEHDRLTERSDEQERRPIGLDQLHLRRCDCRMCIQVMLLEIKEDDKTIG